MSPPPDGVNAQSRWPWGTAIRTYSLYCHRRVKPITYVLSTLYLVKLTLSGIEL